MSAPECPPYLCEIVFSDLDSFGLTSDEKKALKELFPSDQFEGALAGRPSSVSQETAKNFEQVFYDCEGLSVETRARFIAEMTDSHNNIGMGSHDILRKVKQRPELYRALRELGYVPVLNKYHEEEIGLRRKGPTFSPRKSLGSFSV